MKVAENIFFFPPACGLAVEKCCSTGRMLFRNTKVFYIDRSDSEVYEVLERSEVAVNIPFVWGSHRNLVLRGTILVGFRDFAIFGDVTLCHL